MRVLHLVGSPTDDFHADLSRLYARDCLAATEDPAHHESVVAYVTPDGGWRFPEDLSDAGIAAARPCSLGDALARIAALAPDAMVPQLFCLAGMTSYRALFDVLAIPYVGNSAAAMALTADKAQARAVVAAAGVDVPEGELVRAGETPTLKPPVVVKPVDADNSVGVALVREAAEYPAALEAAWAHADAALVEAYVAPGREVRCGILVQDGALRPLPLEEYRVDATAKPIRQAADKLARDPDGALRLVAKDNPDVWIVAPDDPIVERVHAAARRCHVALGCRDYSLFDFRIDADGRPWFLEAGLYCSFARQSVVAVMAHAAGIPTDALFRTTVDECLRSRGR